MLFPKNKKTPALIFIAAGCVALVAAILLAFAVGGPAVFILTLSSVFLNSIGVTILRRK